MDRALLDGTTLMSASRLLSGEDPPTALNVYSLSLLVECMILHKEVIVLDTLPDDDRLTTAGSMFGDAVWVERRSTEDIVERYVGLTLPDFSLPQWADGGIAESPRDEASVGVIPSHHHERGVDPWQIARDLRQVLQRRDPGEELDGYLAMLAAAHRQQFARGRGQWKGEATLPPPESPDDYPYGPQRPDGPGGPYRPYALNRPGKPRPGPAYPRVDDDEGVSIPDRTELRELAAAGSTESAWAGFVERNVGMTDSPWRFAQMSRETYRTEFTSALVTRTNFYLLASEVLAAPYRPDVLRAPICWKFFGRGSPGRRPRRRPGSGLPPRRRHHRCPSAGNRGPTPRP
jgi:hypothetical protein